MCGSIHSLINIYKLLSTYEKNDMNSDEEDDQIDYNEKILNDVNASENEINQISLDNKEAWKEIDQYMQ